MLRRKIYDDLVRWKNREHAALMLKGQRQVGKTFIVEAFARENYDHFVKVDLSVDRDVHAVFSRNLDADTVIDGLKLFRDPKEFVPGSTLLFLDEIQDCPRARTALKSLSMDGRFDVIASGSLLGLSDRRSGTSGRPRKSDGSKVDLEPPPLLPMGYEEQMTMYSMDFEEFLWSRDFPQSAIDEVRRCIREREPLRDDILDRVETHYRDYMIVGGLPASVSAFQRSGDYEASDEALERILAMCRNDINRYNSPSEVVKTSDCFDSIPWQLSDDNKKFVYSRVTEGYGSAEKYGEALRWIRDAGYGNFCYNLSSPERPLSGRTDHSAFKVYMSDTGLLMHMMGEGAMRAIYSGDRSYNMGAVAENAVAEALMKGGYPPRYYRKARDEDRMELDFVLEMGDQLGVIEVKSGKERRSPSLDKVARYWDVDRRIMLSDGNIYVDGKGVEHYPLFAASFVREMEPPWDGPRFTSRPPQS